VDVTPAGDPSPSGRVLPVNDLKPADQISVNLPVPRRALAVGAHPDDVEFGAGATLAKWAAAGCEVSHLILTDGAKGSWDPGRDPALLVATRQQEQRSAAEVLGGGNVVFFGWPDGELRNGVREQWEVCRQIRILRPDVVLGHDPWRRYRLHPDHRNAGYILTDAVVAARDPLFFSDQDLAPHRPAALLLWEADVVNHVEDVAGHEATKVEALLAHRSQHRSTMGITEAGDGTERFAERIVTQLAEHGELGGFALGESFHVMSDL